MKEECFHIPAINPELLYSHLHVKGLFSAGQFNGSSGYEEAAAQGLIAGINAARMLQGKDAFTLDRSEICLPALLPHLIILWETQVL